MVGLFGDGLVDDVLFCDGDSFEEDLRWGTIPGFFVDLVDLVMCRKVCVSVCVVFMFADDRNILKSFLID